MPPRKRKPENRGLPKRWEHYHGAYYYRVPKGQEAAWDGKKRFRLGKTLPEAYKTWAERITPRDTPATIAALLDRYAVEVMPTKSPATRRSQAAGIERLRRVFGHMPIRAFRPQHAYQYRDKRGCQRKLKIDPLWSGIGKVKMTHRFYSGIHDSMPMAAVCWPRMPARRLSLRR